MSEKTKEQAEENEQIKELQEYTWQNYNINKVKGFVETWKPAPSKEDSDHIVHCIDSAMRELCGICPCGSFGRGVLLNDLKMAVGHADEINYKWLKIHICWFYNEVPGSLLSYYRSQKGG